MSKKKAKPMTGAERKASLLEHGAKLAAKHGSKNVTRRMVAKAAGCAEALVSVYMGDSVSAQKAYAKKAKAMGLQEPSKDKQEEIGVKLRAHGPRDPRDSRKRTVKEVKAIKRKVNRSARSGEFVTAAEAKRHPATTVRETVASSVKASGRARTAPETKPARPAEKKPTKPSSRPARQSPALPQPSPANGKFKPKAPPPNADDAVQLSRPLANHFP